MTTGGLIFLIIAIIVYKVYQVDVANKASQYDRSKISVGKMAADSCRDPHKVNQKILRGEYDKDSHWRT